MIEYIEKGQGLHSAIKKAGHHLYQENGIWKSTNDVEVQKIIDSYDPLPELRQAKWKEIQAERDRRTAMPVKVGEYYFHSDQASRTQQIGLVLMGANIPPGLMWKTVGGAYVEMTPLLAQQIFQETANKDQSIFAAAELHRNNLEKFTYQQIIDYDYMLGWPEF